MTRTGMVSACGVSDPHPPPIADATTDWYDWRCKVGIDDSLGFAVAGDYGSGSRFDLKMEELLGVSSITIVDSKVSSFLSGCLLVLV